MRQFYHIPILIFFCFWSLSSKSQVAVSDTGTIQQIIQSLVSEGVVISNISLNCPSGAFGTFADTTNTLNIENGLLLTSGSIFDVPGPNDQPGAGTNNGAPGDSDLAGLVPGLTTFDACFVEFDVTPSSDTLSFNYVFASEEYLEFVNAGVNDVFGFFISGPGITGKQNIAIVPGTANTPVSIDNVNNVVNSAFYIDNGDGSTPAANPNLQYDGYTTVLQARTPVIPCQTYTLKLAVSDVGDSILDSGVFIEKGSLGSFGAKIEPSSAYARFEYAVEGCNNGKFLFIRTIERSFPVSLRWQLGGTAQNGIDYTDINGNLVTDRDTIPAFQDTLELIIVPLADTVNDPLETIVLTLFDPCDDTTSVPSGDSVVLLIRENFVYNAGEDDSVCVGEFVELNSNFFASDSVFWFPPDGLNCTNCPNPLASPNTTTTYTILVQDSITQCQAIDSVQVRVFNFPDPRPISFSDSAFTICTSSIINVSMNVLPDSTYSSLIYRWDSTTAFVSQPDSSLSAFRVFSSRYFPFEVVNENNCLVRDSVFITVFPRSEILMPNRPLICFGSEYLIIPEVSTFPGISYSYKWNPASPRASENQILNPQSKNTIVRPDENGRTSYELIVDNGVCEANEIFDIEMEDDIIVDFTYEDLGEFPLAPIEVIFENQTFSSFQYDFLWSIKNNATGEVIDTFRSEELTYLFDNPGVYDIELLAIDKELFCERSLFFTEKINGIIRPNVITPNGDGLNDQFEIQAPPSQIWSIQIFNRWGREVYSNDAYQNNWSAEGLNSGQYFYEIRLKDSDLRYKGWIEVLK